MNRQFSKLQRVAVDQILEGHNVLVMGSAGTGKSFIVQHCAEEMQKRNLNVSVTATTGIACGVYEKATTIHKWSGIGDGRFDTSEIRRVVENNVIFADAKKRILSTDVLFIDECSMMSSVIFESLHEVCKIKDSSKPFGGIQVILIGDFLQLPPVPNTLYNDNGNYCFESSLFDKLVPHTIQLTEVVRQTDLQFIHIIKEVSSGNVSNETATCLKSLSRPLSAASDGKRTIKLFSNNDQVDTYNRDCILKLQGDLHESIGDDEGEKKYLSRILAPKTLWLKIGAPVMLLKNLSDKLVNGLRGEVTSIIDKIPYVTFSTINKTIPLDKVKFTVYDPRQKRDVAVRIQFPVKLAYGITIHKAQGMTLDRLEVDCSGIFKPGQLGVALGRARSSEGLRVINFSTKYCIKQPDIVLKVLNREPVEHREDTSCCRLNRFVQQPVSTAFITVTEMIELERDEINDQEVGFDDEDFDIQIQRVIAKEMNDIQLPEDLDIFKCLDDMKCTNVITPVQFTMNKILIEIDNGHYIQFCKQEYDKLTQLIEHLNVDHSQSVPAKKLNEFYTAVHAYYSSAEYLLNCLTLFGHKKYTEDHKHICYNVSVHIRNYLVTKKAKLFPSGKRSIHQRSLTAASTARVRYVAGYCVGKVRHKFMLKKETYRYKLDHQGIESYKEACCVVNLLNSFKVDEHYALATTKDPDSMHDITRRQYQSHGLTVVSDEILSFFLKLTDKCLKCLVDENLTINGSDFFQFVRGELEKDTDLYEMLRDTITSHQMLENYETEFGFNEGHVKVVFKKMIKMLLMVMVDQFRKDLLESFNISKKMAHRKEVRVSGKGKGPAKGNAVVKRSLPKRKSDNVPQSDNIETDTFPPVQRKSSRVPTKKKHKYSAEPDSGDDAEETSKSARSPDSVDLCKMCGLGELSKTVEWIQCDGCSRWLHRNCAGLKHHAKWKKMTTNDAVYYCSDCQ